MIRPGPYNRGRGDDGKADRSSADDGKLMSPAFTWSVLHSDPGRPVGRDVGEDDALFGTDRVRSLVHRVLRERDSDVSGLGADQVAGRSTRYQPRLQVPDSASTRLFCSSHTAGADN